MKLSVARVSFSFSQEGNTVGTTEEVEELTIDLEYQCPGEDCFVVIKTRGWSVDDGKELEALISKCVKAAKEVES